MFKRRAPLMLNLNWTVFVGDYVLRWNLDTPLMYIYIVTHFMPRDAIRTTYRHTYLGKVTCHLNLVKAQSPVVRPFFIRPTHVTPQLDGTEATNIVFWVAEDRRRAHETMFFWLFRHHHHHCHPHLTQWLRLRSNGGGGGGAGAGSGAWDVGNLLRWCWLTHKNWWKGILAPPPEMEID